MEKKVEVAIIGAGTSGLSAYREVSKVTQDFLLINAGAYGTTCARVGCMPSKVLIQVANDFHRRHVYPELGIQGGEALTVDRRQALRHVRKLRDRFVGGVLKTTDVLGDRVLTGRAEFVEPGVLRVDNKITVQAKKVVIATGSRPVIPTAWESFRSQVLTSDEIFEQEEFPESMAVLGLGVIGLELGQALGRLGVNIVGVGRSGFIGGLSDPEINKYAVEKFGAEFELLLGNGATVEAQGDKLRVSAGETSKTVDKVLASLGRRPNLEGLGLENLGVELNAKGIPPFDSNTLQVGSLPVYIAGDVLGERAILHEASDEGRIAGYNSVRQEATRFSRRVRLGITFCDPNIATVGIPYKDLDLDRTCIGEVKFDGQGRSLVMSKNKGYLRVYGDKFSGQLLGAELFAPSGEHLAHLLSWAIQQKLTAGEVLQLPFYHPVVEEGLRTALRDLVNKVERPAGELELALCGESGVECLS